MKELLGIDTIGNFKDGPMQDVHWPVGLFGYFPCYSLGAMYAAQWSHAARLANPQVDVQLKNGNPEGFFGWLNENVWKNASLLETDDLSKRVSGETLNPKYFKTHLEQRYF
jgi:carboxypeptidase Taq